MLARQRQEDTRSVLVSYKPVKDPASVQNMERGEMALWLRTFADPAEDPGLFPSPPQGDSRSSVTPVSEYLKPLLVSWASGRYMMHIHAFKQRLTDKNKKNKVEND